MGKPLDLSKFKVARSGEKHTVLKHPEGHEITIFHNKLSKPVKEQLDKLPKYDEGGQVSPPTTIDKDKAKQVSDSFKKALGFASGTPEGTVGDYVEEKPIPVPASQLEANYSAENDAAQGTAPQGNEGQSWADQIGSEIPNVDPNAPIAPEGGISDPSHAHLAEAVKNLSSKFVSAPSQGMMPEAPKAMAPKQIMDPGTPQGGLVEQAQADVGLANQAENAAAQNIQQSQAKNAEIYGQKSEQLQQLHQKYEEIGNNLHQKYEDLAAQVSQGHIDPNQWWSSKSTGSKVLTAIGMLFAGAGAGASGHPEMVSKIIDDSINREIDAQKSNLNNKNTLLGKYMEMYNSLPQAEAAARLTLEASTEGLINQQAAKLNSQNAINMATIMSTQRRLNIYPQFDGLAKGQAMMGMYQNMGKGQPSSGESAYQQKLQDLSVLAPERYKIEEAKYLPGVGVAAKPVPEDVHKKLTVAKDLSEKLAALENFSRNNQGTIFDQKILNTGKAMAADASSALRLAQEQGVFKPSDQHFIESMIPKDPSAFFANYRTIPKYQTIRKLNDQSLNGYLKAYGVKPFEDQQSSQNQAAMAWLKTNPDHPKAAEVRKKLGI